MASVRGDEEPFSELLDGSDVDNFVVSVVGARIESIFNVLFHLVTLNDKQLPICCRSDHLLFVEPQVVCIVVILGNLRKRRQGLKGALLQAPEAPVPVASGDHLVVIAGVKG